MTPTATAEIERLVEAFDVAAQNLGAADYAVHAGLIASAEPKHARTKAALLAALRAAEAERDGLYRDVTNLQWAARNCEDRVQAAETELAKLKAAKPKLPLCWGCEGNPSGENDPCEVCGLSSREVVRAALQSTNAKEGE